MEANRQRAGVALVTGGAKRIGRAIALALAGDGWDVAVHYGHTVQLGDPRSTPHRDRAGETH